jgi:hypothetical protein
MRRDYSSSRLHRLYCAYTVHPDVSSRRSTSRRSLALALVVRPVTTSRGVTTRRPDRTGSLCLCRASGRTVPTLDFSSVGRTGSHRVPGHSVVCRDYLSRGRNRYTSPTPCPGASACRAARRRLLRLRRASGCLGTSRGSSRHSSSTFSPTLCVRVPRHVAWLVAPLIVDFFTYAVRPGASARRAAHR